MLTGTDTLPPVIKGCPFRVGGTALPGEDGVIATWTEPTATDDSGEPVKVARSHAPFTRFPLGPTRVVYYFTDSSGNRANCSFTVSIVTGIFFSQIW